MNKEKFVARFFFKQSCIFLSTESRALTGCAIPCFAFLSVQLSYQSYRTVFCSSAGLGYHFFVCMRSIYKIEKKTIAFCIQKQLVWKKVKRRRIRANRRLSFFSCSLFPFSVFFLFIFSKFELVVINS